MGFMMTVVPANQRIGPAVEVGQRARLVIAYTINTNQLLFLCFRSKSIPVAWAADDTRADLDRALNAVGFSALYVIAQAWELKVLVIFHGFVPYFLSHVQQTVRCGLHNQCE